MCSIFKVNSMCLNNKLDDKEVCKEHTNIILVKTDICNICLENIKEQIYMECGHSFHKECILKWLEKSNKCPCCRKILKNISTGHSIDELILRSLTNGNSINSSFIRNWNISLTTNFIYWFQEMVNTYIHTENDNETIFEQIIEYIRNSEIDLSYFIDFYILDMNNQPIDLFGIELKINEIANLLLTAFVYNYQL